MNSFPSIEEYVAYSKAISSKLEVNGNFERTKAQYRKLVRQFSSIEEFFSQKPEDISKYCNIIVFLSLKYRIKITDELLNIQLRYTEAVIHYFNPDRERFFQICNDRIIQTRWKAHFYPLIVRMLMFLGKSDIDDVKYEDLGTLNCEAFLKCHLFAKPFIDIAAVFYGVYTGKAQPRPYMTTFWSNKSRDDLSIYGTGHPELLKVLKTYLMEEYSNKGVPKRNPLKNLKTLMSWLYKNHYEIISFKALTYNEWLEYKDFIHVSDSIVKPSSKRNKLVSSLRFMKWLYPNGYLTNQIVGFDEKTDISNYEVEEKTQPRQFKNRGQFLLILAKIYTLKPENERDELIKHLVLIATATGLRLSEVLWLCSGCITEISGDVGEIILQVNEKQDLVNKPTSILPWGIESVKFLEERFKERNKDKTPIEFYHEKSRKYFPSLFELDGKMISINTANIELNKYISEIESDYKEGKVTFMKGAKFHGFRHQKFGDIGEVTGGSVTAVKMDSHHFSSLMVRKYLQQNKEKRQVEAYKALEEGKIIGKYAELLKSMLLTPYSPEAYMGIVGKINMAHLGKDCLKEVMKYLGFGFCGAKTCMLAPTCEECDYFWTCNTFSDELAERYAINFILVKSREETILSSSDKENYSLITSLKYQEKWLVELGFDQVKLDALKTKYMKDGIS